MPGVDPVGDVVGPVGDDDGVRVVGVVGTALGVGVGDDDGTDVGRTEDRTENEGDGDGRKFQD